MVFTVIVWWKKSPVKKTGCGCLELTDSRRIGERFRLYDGEGKSVSGSTMLKERIFGSGRPETEIAKRARTENLSKQESVGAMDDDDFGGFEAAETFDSGDGETQSVSPAIPWAAFPAVSVIHGSKTGLGDSLLELPQSSACLLPSEMFMTTGDSSLSTAQSPATSVIHSALTEQVLASQSPALDEVPVSLLDVQENAGVDALADVLEDAEPLESKRTEVSLQQIITNLDIKLQAAEEEKGKMRKELEDMMKTHGLPGTDYLKEKNEEIISHRERYRQLQVHFIYT
ncbi:hypothetical protein NDU88_006273 [Pleurodeles waltl]|uniref:Uncharacterized protein n=1 Tax=Pleurodeles waltl TaxID=8319 RepID=A0AAV7SP23_PLEWA|nr:hypothetical protein NDU88_006273 [Pleurodeles waltl]